MDGHHLRADMRMLRMLARRKSWSDSLTDETREKLAAKLGTAVEMADSARDIASVAKAVATLERNDFEAMRLELDAQKSAQDAGETSSAKDLLADLRAIERNGGDGDAS